SPRSAVMSPPFIACSLSSYATHLDLHSFPTRRSSDLLVKAHPVIVGDRQARTGTRRCATGPLRGLFREAFILLQAGCCRRRLFRSEEHTSELQSRENLVCRLLLEKKKQTKTRCN